MRGLIRVVMILCVCIAAIARVHAESDEPPPYVRIVLPDENCEPVCWQGIQPGMTDYKSAHNMIAALPNLEPLKDAVDSWGLTVDENHWHTVTLNSKTSEVLLLPQEVRLGDVMLALGSPDFYSLSYVVEAREVQYRLIEIYYVEKQLRLTANITGQKRLSPDTLLLSIRYMPEVPMRRFDSRDWHGFSQNLLAQRS